MPLDVAAEVLSNTQLSSDYNVIALGAPDIADQVLPGQFVMVKGGDRFEPLLRRPFSVFQVLRRDNRTLGLSLLSKKIGVSTRLLFDAKPGDRIQCLGPLGRPFAPVALPAEAWMVAGGVGVAPFATLAETLNAKGVPTTLYYGARRGEELFFLDLFERLGVRLKLATEDGSLGDMGRVTIPLERDFKALASGASSASVMIYACGPEPMLAAVACMAASYGHPSQVSVERVMGCGLGGCYSCVIPITIVEGKPHHVRSCIAGPVFRGADIVWQ